MDKLERYRSLIQKILAEYRIYPTARPDSRSVSSHENGVASR